MSAANKRSGILAGGNWILDRVKFIDTYPQQDALANIGAESVSNGGSPFNVLMDLAKLGADFRLEAVGLVGRDVDGDWIRERCDSHGIDTATLRQDEQAPTSYTDVMTVRGTGRRTFFHQRGANAFLGAQHFDFSETRARIFHLGYLLLLDGLDAADAEYGTVAARVLAAAVESGLQTSVDVVSEDSVRFEQVVLPALKWVDYCILNEFEVERTTGVKTRRQGEIDVVAVREASEKLLQAGVRQWVVVHFPEGATALNREGVFEVQGSLRVEAGDIVSSVGAGDAFAAGVLMGFHEGVCISEALRRGVCVAASCLFGVGTSDGIQSLGACLELEKQFGFRELSA